MSALQRVCTGPRLLLGLIILVGLVGYYNLDASHQSRVSDQQAKMTDQSRSSPNPIEGLKVSLAQVATGDDDIRTTVKATVTNTGSGPVTVLTYDSPLDLAALQVGLLSIQPAGASAPLDLPVAHVRRLWPPGLEQLVTLAPGESAENEILFREAIIPPEDLGDKASVFLKGEWKAVWAKTKDEIDSGSLDDPHASADAFQGTFFTDPIEVTVT